MNSSKFFMFVIFVTLLFIPAIGQADELNLTTGEYSMGMGGGDSLNLTTGEYSVGMGGGDRLNLNTGEYTLGLGK